MTLLCSIVDFNIKVCSISIQFLKDCTTTYCFDCIVDLLIASKSFFE